MSLLSRLHFLQEQLREEEGCVVQDPTNLFYLTGLTLSRGTLVVERHRAQLLVDSRYFNDAVKRCPFSVLLMSKEVLQQALQGARRWYFDPDTTSYALATQLQAAHSHLEPHSSLFGGLRAIKDASEMGKLEKSARLLWQGFCFIKNSLRIGVTEKALAKSFELFCLEKGAQKLAFEPIIAFGPHSALPHYRAGTGRLRANQIVLIDIGIVVDHYHSDMTRTLFFGTADPTLSALYAIVREAHAKALSLCRPGTACAELDSAVQDVFKEKQVTSLSLHGLGHGIGLETHEFPSMRKEGLENKKTVLKEGMVLTIEPGLYIPDKGGVRYEDTICITKSGYHNFYTKQIDPIVKR